MERKHTIDAEKINVTGEVKVEEQIMIDEQELIAFIMVRTHDQGIKLSKEDITTVLDLEFEFLKLKGVIEE